MMSKDLSPEQSRRLSLLFSELIDNCDYDAPVSEELETSYTKRVLYPLVATWLPSLRRPELLVRADGAGNAPRALTVGSAQFHPDLEVVSAAQRLLALEVKLMRPQQNPTGSFTKAIGQAVVYRELGFASSHALIIDCRPTVGGKQPSLPSWERLGEIGVYVHYFSVAAGGLLKKAV